MPPAIAPVRLSSARGLAVGAIAVLLLTAVKVAVPALGAPVPYLLYFGAALTAAWYGGEIAGAATTLVAAVVGYGLFVHPHHAPGSGPAMGALIFLLEGALITWITSGLRRNTASSRQASDLKEVALDQVRAVVEGVGDGVTMQDASGRVIFANDHAARISGFGSADEMKAMSAEALVARRELFREDGSPFPHDALPARAVFRGESGAEVLVRFRLRATGEERWLLVRANAVRDQGGAVRFVVNVFRDVTAARRHEEALQLSREWFAVALRSIGDAVITTDAEGKVTFLNAVAEELTGWTTSDAARHPLASVFHILDESSREVVESPVARVLREGKVVGLANHTILVRRDGSERSIDDSAAPITTEAGKLVGVVLVFRDITEQRRRDVRKAFLMRATAELNSSLDYEATLATVTRLAVPAIADWCAIDMREGDGLDRRRLAVAHVDPKKIELVTDIERRYPPDRDASTGVPNVLRTGRPEMMARIPAELVDAAAKDDAHRALLRQLALRSYIAAPIKHGERTLGVISLVMAESKRAYDEDDLAFAAALGERAAVAIENATLYRDAQRLRAEAESANRSKDEFLAMLGHELRNPLAPIVTALHVMGKEPAAPFARERAVIERQLQHVVRLVDDLLDVSRITRGKVELVHEHVALAGVVEQAVEMSKPLLTERNHTLVVDVPPQLEVDGDRTRLAQVVANLLQNAARYTPPGGHISIAAARESTSAVLRVRDDGIGISAEMLPRVFDLFVQETQSIDRSRGGLGIGLSIVRSLVALHGGTVEAKSDGAGKGTEMIVRLPIARAVSAPAPAPNAPSTRPAPEKILVVDDNVDGLEMLALALEHQGFVALTASDGLAAIETAKKERPSAILLDIGLPEIDGYEVARRLRALPELTGVRLVAVTGYGQASDRERSTAAGFDAHLTKPVRIELLADTLRRLRSPKP